MYVETIKNPNSPPAILVRDSFRQNGKVRKRTLANLSKLPPGAIEALRRYFKRETGTGPNGFEIIRSPRSRQHRIDAPASARLAGSPHRLLAAVKGIDRLAVARA